MHIKEKDNLIEKVFLDMFQVRVMRSILEKLFGDFLNFVNFTCNSFISLHSYSNTIANVDIN